MATGHVVAFDVERGLGTIEERSGALHPFHCIAIADGSRSIEVGAAVDFDVVPGHRGAWEAARISPAT